MAKLDKNKWIATNPYEFVKDENGDIFIIILEGGKMLKQKLPDNSITKFILRKLEKAKVL